MMKQRKTLSLLLVLSLVLGLFGTIPSQAAEETWNLALNQSTTASSVANNSGPELAVDGVTNESVQWNSENMKNGQIADDAEQTPQWLQVDLGASGSTISQIKLWYNMKVWPMVYCIETTDTPDVTDSWETVVSVSRPSSNSWVVNGDGQNIADTTANTDTITTTSNPALQMTTLGRYVRFYVEKVNAQAPGNNVNLREIEIIGTNTSLLPAIDTSAVMSGITADCLTVDGSKVEFLADVPENANLEVRGSELENVVANDGTISQWNIGARDVTLLLRVTDDNDAENYAQKNVTVTIPDHSTGYPAEWFPVVDDANAKPEVIPTIQEWYGYEGDFVLTEDSKIILNDTGNVGLDKVAANMQTDIAEISGITLEIVEGTEPGSSNDIYMESLTDASAYDLGEEGYLMVTNEEGLHIYAPTYTGCLYGTITAEQILWQADDHVSIPMGIMRDYPAYEVRGIKLDIARTPYRYELLQDYAKIMLWYKMSEYDLHINDNDNANINGATYESHAGFHRLESDEFPSLVSETKHVGIPADTVNSDYYNNNEDYQGNPHYTKEEWRELAALTEDYGMYMLTEIDLPAHSLLYNKYAAENPDNITWLEGGIAYTGNELGTDGGIELMDLTGANSERALRFAKTLWNEYTSGNEPTIYGDIVHIGADEYWVHNTATHNAFARFADEMRQVIQGNLGKDTKIRMWGAGSSSFETAEETLDMTASELAEHYQLDIWHTNYENPVARVAEGYEVVNCRDAYLYGNPGRTNRDLPNAEYLYNDWNPTIFDSNASKNLLIGEPNLLGAKAVIWGDQSQEGMTEKDVHQRVLTAISIVSEKTWNGTDEDDTFAEYEIRASRLAEGPGTQIAMEVESESALVLDYDFENISSDGTAIYDASGNGYNAVLTGGSVNDGWLIFDGDTLLETPVQTLSYPYTVSFDLKLSAADGDANTDESSLFSGYDGRIQVAGQDGHLSAEVNYFTRDFEYTVPTNNTEVDVTLVGTFQGTKLYVDGELVTFLSQKADADGLLGAVTSLYSSVLLPLEKIGQDFHGQMANLKVYNKALSAEEIAAIATGTDDGKVNVAQNTHAGGDSYATGDAQDNGEQRTRVAMKAIDGDAFTVAASTTAQPDTTTSEIYSYWRGDHADSSLTVDLGQEREVSEIGIQWRYGGKGKDLQILTSLDGENWTVAKEVKNNQDFFQSIKLDSVVTARYVKMQGIASNASVYMIQEFMIYEQVDKSELETLLAEAETIVSDNEIDFETTVVKEQALFDAVVFARAMQESPLTTQEEVNEAFTALETAINDFATIENPFTDVYKSDYYYDPVMWAVQNGITDGWTPTLYEPNMGCTRGQVVTFLWRAAGEPKAKNAENPFEDVAENAYYYDAVLWAVEKGITDGWLPSEFAPDMVCTRGQIVTFIWRAAGEPKADNAENPFEDVAENAYYYDAVLWAVEKQITDGWMPTEFAPDMNCTRGQIVTFLYRAK